MVEKHDVDYLGPCEITAKDETKMKFEEYRKSLATRPSEEHDALWSLYNYTRFETLTRDLRGLRDETRRLEELPANVIDFDSHKKKLTNKSYSVRQVKC